MANPRAPVCHVSADEPTVPHKPVLVASIPAATDLATALAAIAALTQNVNALAGRLSQGARGPGGANGAPGKAAPFNTRWAESSRTTQERTITDDTGQFSVTVQQIVGLSMVDAVTGERWTWKQ